MFKRVGLSLVALLLAAGALSAQERAGDKGENAAQKQLRMRTSIPRPVDIDSAVTLDALLSKKDESAYNVGKAATIEGYVVQVEKEEDGDIHVVLASSAGETDTRKWVIVETTLPWQQKDSRMKLAALRGLIGKKVKVTGWLYYEPDTDQPDPRGTRWELHPVTEITAAK